MTSPLRPVPTSAIAPPWRRVAAGTLDLALLIAAALSLAYWGFDVFAQFDSVNFILGMLLATAYAWFGACAVTGGSTLGKWLLRIRVGRAHEDVPAFALRRSIALVWPCFLLAAFDLEAMGHADLSPWRWTAVTLGVSVLAANALLLVWPQEGHRLLHDRMGRSCVYADVDTTPRNRDPLTEWQSALLWCVPPLVFIALCVFVPTATPPTRSDLATVIVQGPDTRQLVSNVTWLTYQEPVGLADGTPRPTLVIDARLAGTTYDDRDFARNIALAVYAQSEPHGAYDAVEVRLRQTVDFGLAHWSRTRTVSVPAPHKRLAPLAKLPPDVAAARQSQMDGAFHDALRLAGAEMRFMKEHLRIPNATEIAASADLRPVLRDDGRVSISASGAVEVTFSGGPLVRHSFSLVPVGKPENVHWACARHDIPADYFDPRCR